MTRFCRILRRYLPRIGLTLTDPFALNGVAAELQADHRPHHAGLLNDGETVIRGSKGYLKGSNKMRTRIGTIHIVVLVALAVGAAAGWFAAGARGERKCGNVELWKCGNVETANVGRARSPSAPDGRVCRTPALMGTIVKGQSRAILPVRFPRCHGSSAH